MKTIFFLTAIMLLCCCGIQFQQSVRHTDADTFIRECNIEFADGQHFEYHALSPSVVFIYSDEVKSCRRQAKAFNEASLHYPDSVVSFWAINERDAEALLSRFGNEGKLPIYLFINQVIAQKVYSRTMDVQDIHNCCLEHFGILPQPNSKP